MTPLVSYLNSEAFYGGYSEKNKWTWKHDGIFCGFPDFEKAGTDPKKDKRLQEDKKK